MQIYSTQQLLHISRLLFLQHMTATVYRLITGVFSCFPSIKHGITYTVGMTKEPFLTKTQT